MTSYPYILRTDITLSSTDIIYGTNYDSATMGYETYSTTAKGYTLSHHPAYTFKDNVSVKFANNIPLTTMPIPTINFPLLLNLGGANISMNVSWKTVIEDDIAPLLLYFNSANPSANYLVDLTAFWGYSNTALNNAISNRYTFNGVSTTHMQFNGVVSSLQIEEKPGAIVWINSITILIGEEVT